METYYLSLRPSSLNSIYRSILKATQELTEGQILPTRGSFILLSLQLKEQQLFHGITNLIDEWDLSGIHEYVSQLEISSVNVIQSKTLLANGKLNPTLEEKLKELIDRFRSQFTQLHLQTEFPRSFIVYKGDNDEKTTSYIEHNFTTFNKAEWIIAINRRGSAPLYLKDR
jgi:hypothetical protein